MGQQVGRFFKDRNRETVSKLQSTAFGALLEVVLMLLTCIGVTKV